MKVGGIELPCGCDQRREIMFTEGKPDLALVLLIGLPLALLITTIYLRNVGT